MVDQGKASSLEENEMQRNARKEKKLVREVGLMEQ